MSHRRPVLLLGYLDDARPAVASAPSRSAWRATPAARPRSRRRNGGRQAASSATSVDPFATLSERRPGQALPDPRAARPRAREPQAARRGVLLHPHRPRGRRSACCSACCAIRSPGVVGALLGYFVPRILGRPAHRRPPLRLQQAARRTPSRSCRTHCAPARASFSRSSSCRARRPTRWARRWAASSVRSTSASAWKRRSPTSCAASGAMTST